MPAFSMAVVEWIACEQSYSFYSKKFEIVKVEFDQLLVSPSTVLPDIKFSESVTIDQSKATKFEKSLVNYALEGEEETEFMDVMTLQNHLTADLIAKHLRM